MHRCVLNLVCGLGPLCVTAGCGPSDEPAQPLAVVVSGDTAGWIVPCGCTSNQSGGMLRRGGYLEQLRGEGQVLYFDAGGAIDGTSDYDRLKFAAVLQGEAALDVAGHNIAAAEAALGAEFLRRVAEESGVPLLTCNVRDSAGQLLGERIRLVQAAGRRIAVAGVLADEHSIPEVQIDPPRQSILAALESLTEEYDSLVVLAYLAEKELVELAANLPEADLVVGGPTGQSVAPRRVGPVWVASATNKGKFLAKFVAPTPESPNWRGAIVEMNAAYHDHARQRANLDEFYQALTERDFTPAQTSFAPHLPRNVPVRFQISGTDSCRDCHAADCEVWNESQHSNAWSSLAKTGAHVDAYCQQCHTTGFGLPGGFVSAGRSPMHAAVGCESCHGPSHGHAADAQIQTTFAGQAQHQCVACHDRENSPEFAYDSYWEAVRHGADNKAADKTGSPGRGALSWRAASRRSASLPAVPSSTHRSAER